MQAMQAAHTRVDTPLGPYALTATARGLARVAPADARCRAPQEAGSGDGRARAHLEAAAAALRDYFAGARRDFDDLTLAPEGGAFERLVRQALREIPFGRTRSYGELARGIGRPGAARAVGLANARNPLALVVPCHRVIGSDGSLTGYAGGLWRKRWLLAHEGARSLLLLSVPGAARGDARAARSAPRAALR
jgi:methylated-DNA-[protein]-cysteine S-methyltransferase